MVSIVEVEGVGEEVGGQSRQGELKKRGSGSNWWQGRRSQKQSQGRGRADSFLQFLIKNFHTD